MLAKVQGERGHRKIYYGRGCVAVVQVNAARALPQHRLRGCEAEWDNALQRQRSPDRAQRPAR